MDCSIKGLYNFNAEKTQLFLFYHPNNTSAIDVQIDGSVIDKSYSFKMPCLLFLLKCNNGSSTAVKTAF